MISLAVGVAAAATYLCVPGLEQRLTGLALDIFFTTRARPPEVSPSLVLVEIDDDSLEEFEEQGITWPWPRSTYARMARALEQADAKCVAFDVIFAGERDKTDDEDLAKAAADFPVALPVDTLSRDPLSPRQKEALDASLAPAPRDLGTSVVQLSFATPPYSALAASASGLGHVAVDADPDGIYRRMAPVVRLPDGILPSFPLRLAMLAMDAGIENVDVSGSSIRVAPPAGSVLRVPIDRAGLTIVNFPGPRRKAFPCRSFVSLLEGLEQHPDDLEGFYKNKVVLIGATFEDSREFVATPIGRRVPLVELLAGATNMFLTGRIPRAAPPWLVAALAVALPVIATFFYRNRPFVSAALYLTVTVVFVAVAWVLFDAAVILVNPFPVVAALLVAGLLNPAIGYRVDLTKRRRVQQMLSKFACSELVSLAHGSEGLFDPSLRMRRELTVLFADVADFTRYCDSAEPEEVIQALEGFYRVVEQSVEEAGGYVSKLLGDGMLCLFRDQGAGDRKEFRAVRAAQLILNRLADLAAGRRMEGLRPLSARIGVATGVVTAGIVGGVNRFDYTVIGRFVNLAARLAAEAAANGVVADDATAARIRHSQNIRLEPREISVKGFERAVNVAAITFSEPGESGVTRNA